MKKHLLLFFFTGQLLLIFFQALWANIDSYWSYHFDEKPYIPIINLLKQNAYTEPYYILSGINTGYGFYGIHASTNKYLRATFLDSTGKVLKTDRYFDLNSSNGISRFGGYASYLTNYISETKDLIEADTLPDIKNRPDVVRLRERYQFRKDFVVKTLKWHGKKKAKSIPGCASYKIELLTIVPVDIWQRERKTKPKLYVIQEGTFPVH